MVARAARLMIVIHSLRGGGAERVAADLATAWQRMGMQVSLVTQTDARHDMYLLPSQLRRYGLDLAIERRSRLSGLLNNLRRWRALRRLMRQEQPDIVLGMMTRSSVLAVLAARGLPCKVIASEHTHPPVQNLPRVWQFLRRWAYRRADRVVALTQGTARWLEAAIPGVHTSVIPNAVHWPLIDAEPVLEPRKPAGRQCLLAVGRLHPVKGFDCLLQAFARLATTHPDWDLVILGEGRERARLEALRDRLRLQTRVQLPGRVGNMAAWYTVADLFVLSSRAEGLSNVLLEAMASGLPCVAFDCDTGPREIIRDGLDGVLVRPVSDAAALANALAAIMQDAALRQRLAGQAIQVRERFGAPRIMSLWQELFDGLGG